MPLALRPLADLLHVGRLHLLQLLHRVRDEHLLQRCRHLDLRSDAALLVDVNNEKRQHNLRMIIGQKQYGNLQQEK